MSEFELHPQLAADTVEVARLPLCRVLLMNDANYPWFILVPARAEVREIYQLGLADRQALLSESCRVGRVLMDVFDGDKLNIAALGNVVPQLHLHHIVRHHGDPAWPAPVWGRIAAVAYTREQRETRLARVRTALAAAPA